MSITGGPLNLLNGKMGISAPHKSVPIMKLIRVHSPKTKSQLEHLIETHYLINCPCGIRSQGTVGSFGQNLYDAQLPYWGDYKYSIDQCKQWAYDLFITQSLRGLQLELKAIQILRNIRPTYKFSEPDQFLDEQIRIDILISSQGRLIAGIQVKPDSYKNMRSEVISFGIQSNNRWNKPVYYLYYNNEGTFINLDEIIAKLIY